MLRLTSSLAALLILGGFGLGAARVSQLEQGELDLETAAKPLSEWRTGANATRVSARLLSTQLEAGERVFFELCSPQPIEARVVQDALSVAVLNLDRNEKMLLVPLDAPHVAKLKTSARGSCLPLGGGVVEVGGEHSLELVWLEEGEPSAALQQLPLVGRVLARRALAPWDVWLVVAIGLGALLCIGLLWAWPRAARGGATAGPEAQATTPHATSRSAPLAPATDSGHTDDTDDTDDIPGLQAASPARRLVLAGVAFVGLAAATQLPLYGASLAMLKGLLLVGVQVGSALLLVQAAGSRTDALALVRPARPLAWLAGALIGALLLRGAAQVSLAFVPATSEAPIQTFISWPSGMLSFAALGVLLPVAEEVFFRGYLYRAALVLGRGAAFALTSVAFVALHAQQSWGNWGGLVAIAITGLTLTGLRALSGSVLVPALAHLLYNFVLSVASF